MQIPVDAAWFLLYRNYLLVNPISHDRVVIISHD